MKRVCLCGLLSVVLCLIAARANAREDLDRLVWLAGRWERNGPGFSIQEQWMDPRGGMMVGMSRTVKGRETLEYRFLRIEERDGRLIYVATPSGERETVFLQEELSDSSVVFANPDHDFPQRISYRLLSDGSLIAQIEGVIEGQRKAVDFPMKRSRCE